MSGFASERLVGALQHQRPLGALVAEQRHSQAMRIFQQQWQSLLGHFGGQSLQRRSSIGAARKDGQVGRAAQIALVGNDRLQISAARSNMACASRRRISWVTPSITRANLCTRASFRQPWPPPFAVKFAESDTRRRHLRP